MIIINKNIKNLIGEIFGKLIVIDKDIEKSLSKGKIYYICQCSCENKTIKSIRSDQLISGKIQNCGCVHKEQLQIQRLNKPKCKVEECSHVSETAGYCNRHYYQMKRCGEILSLINMEDRICCVKNCNMNGKETQIISTKNKDYPYLCGKHYMQLRTHNKVFERTLWNKNEIIIYDNYAEIVLYNYQIEEIARSIIDVEDINKIKNLKWFLMNNGYVATKYPKFYYLHRYLKNPPKDKIIDHINRNPLDNRKCNLRICEQKENTYNKRLSSLNTSGVAGVYWNGYNWVAQIVKNSKLNVLGFFNNIETAREVRRKAELEYFGEYSIDYFADKDDYIIKEDK